MDSLRVLPSKTFLSVLKELQEIPGAPKSIVEYFQPSNKNKTKAAKSDEELYSKIEDIEDKSSETSDNPLEADETKHFPSGELLLRTRDVRWCHDQIRGRGMDHRQG